jgi:hypothetical protein
VEKDEVPTRAANERVLTPAGLFCMNDSSLLCISLLSHKWTKNGHSVDTLSLLFRHLTLHRRVISLD